MLLENKLSRLRLLSICIILNNFTLRNTEFLGWNYQNEALKWAITHRLAFYNHPYHADSFGAFNFQGVPN